MRRLPLIFLLLISSLTAKQYLCISSASSLHLDRMTTPPTPLIKHPKGYVAYKSDHPIVMTGRMDDPAWAAAPWSDDFVDILGPDNNNQGHPEPWHKTQVKILWDDSCLYIGAWMEEPTPWANLTLHDSVIFKDNDFEVFIDPDSDNHNYCEIEVNAHGALWDLFLAKPYREGFGPVIHNWETLASSEPTEMQGPTGWRPLKRVVFVDGELNSKSGGKGWGVELSIPWSIFSFIANEMACPPKPKDKWRINFSRVHWRTQWSEEEGRYVKEPMDQSESNWVWSPMYEVAMHKPELWGYVQFSSKRGHVAGAEVGEQGEGEVDVFEPDPSWAQRCFLMEGYR